MTPQPAPQQPQRPVSGLNLNLLFVVATVVLLILAAFAAAGDALGGIPAWTWGFAGLCAWYLSERVP